MLGRRPVASASVVAEPICSRLERLEGLDISLLLGGIGAARSERHFDVVASLLGGQFDGGTATEDDEVSDRHSDTVAMVEGDVDALERDQHLGELLRLVD